MVKFEEIHEDLVPVLKSNGITENDLFHRESDLYIGCPDIKTAESIMMAGIWESMSGVFKPNEGSEMENYPYAVDIFFAYLGDFPDFEEVQTNKVLEDYGKS